MSPKRRNIQVKVKDTVFDPALPRDQAKVHVREKNGKKYYKVWVYIEGNDLPYFESVTYTLHQTYFRPVWTVSRSPANPNCDLIIWTLGAFLVKVTLLDKQGFSYSLSHRLTYERELPKEMDKYFSEPEDPDTTNALPTTLALP